MFLLSIILKRRRRKKDRHGDALIFLLTGLMLWYTGNFLALLLRQMNLERITLWLEWVDLVAFFGLSFLPALRLHTHCVYYVPDFTPRPTEKRIILPLVSLLYGRLLAQPFALTRLFEAPTAPPVS